MLFHMDAQWVTFCRVLLTVTPDWHIVFLLVLGKQKSVLRRFGETFLVKFKNITTIVSKMPFWPTAVSSRRTMTFCRVLSTVTPDWHFTFPDFLAKKKSVSRTDVLAKCCFTWTHTDVLPCTFNGDSRLAYYFSWFSCKDEIGCTNWRSDQMLFHMDAQWRSAVNF